MKTIIFSDTHLTKRFNVRKFMFLVEIIKDADRVIINGDFWDRTFTDFDGFVNSKWKLLFPLLKSKDTIYLYGNHDLEKDIDERVNLFSDVHDHKYEFSYRGYDFYVTHGHTIKQGLDYLYKYGFVNRVKKPAQFFFDVIEWFFSKFLRSYGKKLFAYRYLDNRSIRKYVEELPLDEYVVCGHTHLAFFKPKHRYINTGSIRFGYAHYLELDGKSIKLKYSRY